MNDFSLLAQLLLTAISVVFGLLVGLALGFADGKRKGFNEGLLASSLRDGESCLKMSALMREFIEKAQSALEEMDVSLDQAEEQFIKSSSLDLK